MARSIFRALLGVFFVLAGLNHFRTPAIYLRMMPPGLPFPALLNRIAGAAEMAAALG